VAGGAVVVAVGCFGLAGLEFVGCAVGSGDVDVAGVGVAVEAPVAFVDADVVPAAEQDEVVGVGVAVVADPFAEVVAVAPVGGGGAAGPAAVWVAGGEDAAEGGWGVAVGAAEFEGDAVVGV